MKSRNTRSEAKATQNLNKKRSELGNVFRELPGSVLSLQEGLQKKQPIQRGIHSYCHDQPDVPTPYQGQKVFLQHVLGYYYFNIIMLQISHRLRLYVVLLCIAVIVLSWQALKIRNTIKKKVAIEEIVNMGGIERSRDAHGLQRLLQNIFGQEYYSRVTDVLLADCPVEDRDIVIIANLNGLQYLDLSGTMVTDSGVEYLSKHARLKKLDLGRTALTDVGMKSIGRMTSLEELILDSTKITNQSLKLLERLHSLKSLSVRGTQITEAGVYQLEQALTEINTVEYGPLSSAHIKCPARQRDYDYSESEMPAESK